MKKTIEQRLTAIKKNMSTTRLKATWGDVAKAVDYTTVTLRAWRNGTKSPSRRGLKAIKEAERRYNEQ